MIKKIYRLNEGQVKKVLKYGKPFFSYGIVANSTKNDLNYNRFAIIIGAKSVINNITRNFFRRLFYNLVGKTILNEVNKDEKQKNINSKDIVFVIKKQIKLDKKDSLSIKSFEKDVNFLTKNTINKN